MSLARKLNLKPGMRIAVLHLPVDLALDLGDDVAVVTSAADADAVLLFVTSRSGLAEAQGPLVEAAEADRLAWVSYPKGGRLGTDLNRDVLWGLLAASGIRPVRQVAIDDTWSALRFRPGRS